MTTSGSGSGSTEQPGSTTNKPLRPGYVDPTVRSAQARFSLSEEEIKTLRAIPYREYLKTPWWFARRNQALRDVGYRCVVCESKRQLQVHHITYENLGCEENDDLAVVCRGCHLGHHYNQTQEGIGVYVRLLSSVIQDMPTAEFVDIVEEAKKRCVQAKIRLHPERFHAAVSRVNDRIAFRPPERSRELYQVAKEGQPLTKAEAAGILARLGGGCLMKHMPEVKPITTRQAECMRALRIVMEGIADQIERCDEAERQKP